MSFAASLPSRRTARAWPAQVAVPVGVALLAELTLRDLYAGGNALGQRLCEVHGWLSLAALLLVLTARPLKLLPHRRALGLSAFGFALLHLLYAYSHVFFGEVMGFFFLSPAQQMGVGLGGLAMLGLLPLAVTSTNAAMRRMGARWKRLHRITPTLLVLAAVHSVWVGVHCGFSAVSVIVLVLSAFLLRRKKVNP